MPPCRWSAMLNFNTRPRIEGEEKFSRFFFFLCVDKIGRSPKGSIYSRGDWGYSAMLFLIKSET